MAEGYDTDCFHSTIDDFKCAICLCVLKDPMQCEKNEHYFCSGCIKEHLKKTSHRCPTCNDDLTVETLRKAPRIVADFASRFKISCVYASRGCDAVVELEALQRHLQNCDFVPVTCSNDGCQEVLNKRDVKRHEHELCPFRIVMCKDCGTNMSYCEYDRHSCVLRRDVNEMKNDLADMRSTQQKMMKEMKEGLQRVTIAIENLEKSCRNVNNKVNAISTDIYVIAGMGCETEAYLSSVERFNLFTQTWTEMPVLKKPRFFPAAVLFENQIIVCGGDTCENVEGLTNSIEVLDLKKNPTEWQEFPVGLPIKVGAHKCVVYGNCLLIIGGYGEEDEIFDTIYELLLVPPYTSKLLCRMNKKRAVHGAELFDDKVLIVGGKDTETDAEIFDIARNECLEMPPLPSPLWGMGTVRKGDTMILIGGVGTEENCSNEIIEYNVKTGQSKIHFVMKTKRAGCSAVCHENTAFILGGSEDNPKAVDCCNLLSGSWKELPSMTEDRLFASVVVVNKENFEF